MNIPVRGTQIINGRKGQHVCWVISYDVDFGTWLKRKIHDQPLQNSSLLCETVRYANIYINPSPNKTPQNDSLFKQSEEAREMLNNFEIYINKMKDKKGRKDIRRAARIASEAEEQIAIIEERLIKEKAERKAARKEEKTRLAIESRLEEERIAERVAKDIKKAAKKALKVSDNKSKRVRFE
jgi:hypothetical protein